MNAPVAVKRIPRTGVAALLALGVWASACGGTSNGQEGTVDVASAHSAPDVPTTVIPSSTPATPPSSVAAPSTTLPPLAPWQVLVAVAKPEIAGLTLFDAPNGAPLTVELPQVNPWYFGGELALLVRSGRESDQWLQVAVATRPNGTTAWIRASDVTIRTHRIHAEIALGARRLRVWDADELLVDTAIVIGKPSTPTPLGDFFVNARIERSNPGGAYGPWILSLSGFSEVLDSFDGGLPEIAMHGTNQPALIGQARSNGCIRIPNDVIRRIADVVPLGTPVAIVA